jgi:hypothetical protein
MNLKCYYKFLITDVLLNAILQHIVKYLQVFHKLCPWPLLLIIYTNDIADKLLPLSRLFADDTSFGYSNQDTMQLKKFIAHD